MLQGCVIALGGAAAPRSLMLLNVMFCPQFACLPSYSFQSDLDSTTVFFPEFGACQGFSKIDFSLDMLMFCPLCI